MTRPERPAVEVRRLDVHDAELDALVLGAPLGIAIAARRRRRRDIARRATWLDAIEGP